jgi:hypothetical protein
MRKHVAWYVKGLPHAAAVKDRANRLEREADVRALLLEYLEWHEAGGTSESPPPRMLASRMEGVVAAAPAAVPDDRAVAAFA